MSLQTVLDKLQIREEKNVLIQGLPSSIEKQFTKLSYAKNVTPLLKSRKIDFALIFAINQNQMNNIINDVKGALHPESRLWISYPKVTSKIVTDLNRDSSWEYVIGCGFEAVRLVSLDHVWSAMRFRSTQSCKQLRPAIEGINFDNKAINTPIELQELFSERKHAAEFFDSLSIAHKSDYIDWYHKDAHVDDNAQKLVEMVEMLEAGLLNPNER
jgi:hypothetical protein